MSTQNIIRAWKDESYRSGLSEAERAALPPNPAGVVALATTESGRNVIFFTLPPVCTTITNIGCSHLTCW
jgi:mersacidin/lichenicidin family type 2 lantibiotic